jgi:glycosyltransferase involved in cell wall biosynthesis
VQTDDRPLTTFALVAYNQVAFIREAVDAALAQDYSPLEIILSDDCSTDGTFEAMVAAIADYRGPHQVTARKTEANRGSLLHVAEVAAMAKGALLVLAAGDDLSKPQRTRVLVDAWQATGAWGLCSRFDRIDPAGKLLESAVASGVLAGHGFRDFFHEEEGSVRIVHGCSSAYDARAFGYLKLSSGDFILSEDGAMSVLLNLLGKTIVNLDDSLVCYRESPNSLTNSGAQSRLTFARIADDERRIEWFAGAQANRCRLFLRMNDYLGVDRARRMKVEAVEAELERQTVRANWRKTGLLQRLRFALGDRRSTWAWPRMLGLNIFFVAKWLSRRFTANGEGVR